MKITRVLCAVGLHHWTTGKTADGEKFRTCARCGKDDSGLGSIAGTSGLDNQAWPR